MIGLYYLNHINYITTLFIYFKNFIYYLTLFILVYIYSIVKRICTYKYSKSAQRLINTYGNCPITKIEIGRKALTNFVTIANVLSIGHFKKNNQYDTLYHVCLRITVGKTQLLVEKNSIVTITKWENFSNIEFENIELNRTITLNELLTCAQQKIGYSYFKFNFFKNNCQDFVINLLKCSKLGTDDNYKFIKQHINGKKIKGKKIINNIINIISLVLPFIF